MNVGLDRLRSMTAKGVSRLVDSEGLSKRSQMVNVRHLKPYVRRTDTPKMSASLLMSRN